MRSSHSFTLATALLSLLRTANAYTLVQTYDSSNFFNEFNFFSGTDPTNGFVDYVQQDTAQTTDLINYQNNQVYLGVDHTTYNPAGGRASVRLSSNQAFSKTNFQENAGYSLTFPQPKVYSLQTSSTCPEESAEHGQHSGCSDQTGPQAAKSTSSRE